MAVPGSSATLRPTQIADIAPVAQAVARARRIAVVCGAGISCAAGIPDFRSGEGLFKTLKDRNPKAGLTSGKDLFNASLFQSDVSTSLFYQMIRDLRMAVDNTEPTAFHRLLKELDDCGKLFRVYTQNIDGLEAKAGLSFGLDAVGKPAAVAGVKRKRAHPKAPRMLSPSSSLSSLSPSESEESSPSISGPENTQLPTPPSSKYGGRAAATSAACRVVPLHGSMHTLSCTKCHHRIPLLGADMEALADGQSLACPKCSLEAQTRTAMSARSRGVGLMRVDVVLYGEEHADALRIGEITQRDLMGARPDLLVVAGTSIKVPGTKRLIRELAKVVQPALPKEGDIRSVYINLWEPSSEMKGVFDTWVQGDVQEATRIVVPAVRAQIAAADKRAKALARRKGGNALGFPVVKGQKGAKKKAIPRPPAPPKPPPQPKVKASYQWEYMVDKNVFKEVPMDLPPRHAKRYPVVQPAPRDIVAASQAPVIHTQSASAPLAALPSVKLEPPFMSQPNAPAGRGIGGFFSVVKRPPVAATKAH